MQPERILRSLALNISTTIQQSPDVLQNRVVDVPNLDGAEFAPPVDNGLQSPPNAFRLVEGILALHHPDSLREIFELFRIVERSLDSYCHALLTGPDGPLKCVSPLGAFVLFGPDTLYKDHSHAPNEVYLALTEGGEWRVGDSAWRQLGAGQTIFIPSNAVHAIRTTTKPLLTFSFWLEAGDMEEIAI